MQSAGYTMMPESTEPSDAEALVPPAGPAGALCGPASGPLAQQQQQQPVYPYTAPKVLYDGFKARQALGLGVTQICAGILCIIFNAVAISVYDNFATVGHGFWGGLVCIVAGIMGVVAAKCKTKCKVAAYMVLCIVAAGTCLFIVIFGVTGAMHTNYAWRDPYSRCLSDIMYHEYHVDNGHTHQPCETPSINRAAVRLWMNILLVLLAVLEAVTSIWGSTLCCKVACCGQRSPIMIPVQYIPMQGTAQFVVMTPPQQGGGPMIVQPAGTSYPSYQPAAGSTGVQGGHQGAVGGQNAPLASGPPMYGVLPPQYSEQKVALL